MTFFTLREREERKKIRTYEKEYPSIIEMSFEST